MCRVSNLSSALEFLKNSGVACVALSEKSAVGLPENTIKAPYCLVLGDEGYGISSEVMKLCDNRIRIPMVGNTASLNVSVSAGIALYALNATKI